MANRDEYDQRRYAGRNHQPAPESDGPTLFVDMAEHEVYVYIGKCETNPHRITLPGTATVALDFNEEGIVVGVKLANFSQQFEVLDILSGPLADF